MEKQNLENLIADIKAYILAEKYENGNWQEYKENHHKYVGFAEGEKMMTFKEWVLDNDDFLDWVDYGLSPVGADLRHSDYNLDEADDYDQQLTYEEIEHVNAEIEELF